MGYAIVIGGLLLLYFGAKGGTSLGTASTALAGAAHGAVKLGNADPNFEPWLAEEIGKLIGPVSGAAAFRQTDRDQLDRAIRGRRLFSYVTGGPVTGTGSAASFAAGITAEASAVPVIGSAFSFVSSILGVFGAHHAAAVAKEQSTLKAAEPQVNQALDQIDQAYKLGQLGSAQVKIYLEELYTQFVAGLAAISEPAAFDAVATQQTHHCNAGCTQERQLRGILDAMELFDY